MKSLLLLCSALLSAQNALDTPPVAMVLDSSGRLTAIHGLAGNFIPDEPGAELLAYSNDGEIEWRLEAGRLSATRAGQTAVYPTTATVARFSGPVAYLPEFAEAVRLDSEQPIFSIAGSPLEPSPQLAGRSLTWAGGKLHISQPDGSEEIADCPVEPSSSTAASAQWAHLVIDGRSHLLRLDAGRVALFALPLRRRR